MYLNRTNGLVAKKYPKSKNRGKFFANDCKR